MLKKMTVLAMAVGIVAALALPTAASAAWKQHNTALQQNVTIPFTGNAAFQSALGGVTCQVTSSVQFKAPPNATTGTINTFDVHPQDETTNCKGTGLLSPCQIHNVNPQVDPTWVFHTTAGASTAQITVGVINSQLTGGFCGVKAIQITPGNVLATPNQPNTVTSLGLSGNLQAHIQTNNSPTFTVDPTPINVEGSVTIENASQKHIYSI